MGEFIQGLWSHLPNPLSDVVTNAGFAVAAATALGLGWMRRQGSKWAPPDEAVSRGTTKVGALVTAVLLVVMYAFLKQSGPSAILAALGVVFLVLAVGALLFTTYLMTAYGYEYQAVGWFGSTVKRRHLGGKKLTEEAKNIKTKRGVSVARLVFEAQDEMTLVFEPDSIAAVHTQALAAFLLLQSAGSLALGAAGLLLSNIAHS